MSAAETGPEGSRAAGGCVLVALAVIVAAVLARVAPEVGVLAVWVVGAAVVWWRAAHRKGTDLPLPSPTEPLSPESELPGQGPIAVSHREGMSIFLRDDDTNPARTHVHVVHHDQDAN